MAVIGSLFGFLTVAADSLAEREIPRLHGVWVGPAQTLDDELWDFEDFPCFLGCPAETRDFARSLFRDPANFTSSYARLHAQVMRHRTKTVSKHLTEQGRRYQTNFNPMDDPAIRCEPYGLVRQALSPVPIQFEQQARQVKIRYELWEAERVVHMADSTRAVIADLTLLGRSQGAYEDGALLIETSGIRAHLFEPSAGAFHSDDLRAVERYTLSRDGERLDLTLTLFDAAMLSRPLVFVASWRRAPQAQLYPDRCVLFEALPK